MSAGCTCKFGPFSIPIYIDNDISKPWPSSAYKCYGNYSAYISKFFKISIGELSYDVLFKQDLYARGADVFYKPSKIYINCLYVDWFFRKCGVGSCLMNALIRDHGHDNMELYSINNTMNFYHKFGFRPVYEYGVCGAMRRPGDDKSQ